MPEEAATAPSVVDEQVAGVSNVVAEVGLEYKDEASASNITVDAAELQPPSGVRAHGVDACRTKCRMARR